MKFNSALFKWDTITIYSWKMYSNILVQSLGNISWQYPSALNWQVAAGNTISRSRVGSPTEFMRFR